MFLSSDFVFSWFYCSRFVSKQPLCIGRFIISNYRIQYDFLPAWYDISNTSASLFPKEGLIYLRFILRRTSEIPQQRIIYLHFNLRRPSEISATSFFSQQRFHVRLYLRKDKFIMCLFLQRKVRVTTDDLSCCRQKFVSK